MEKEIKEDFTITWPLWRVLTGIVVFLALLAGVITFFPDHNWRFLAEMVAFSAATIWFVRFTFRSAVKKAATNPNKWLLANDGLVRLYGSGQRETIRWEQIRFMKWGKHVGVRIVWEESERDHRSQEFRDEIRTPQAGRCGGWIRVGEGEAREMFQYAKQTAFRVDS